MHDRPGIDSRRRRGTIAVLLVGLLAVPVGTRAQEDPEARARAHFQVGRAYYNDGKFDEAAREFEQAYELTGAVPLLYNIYIAHRDAQRPRQARDALKRFLALAPDDVANRGHLEGVLAGLDERVATLEAPVQQDGSSGS